MKSMPAPMETTPCVGGAEVSSNHVRAVRNSVIAGSVMFLAAAAVLLSFYLTMVQQLDASSRNSLRRAAIACALAVDPNVHVTLTDVTQQDSPPYLAACDRLEKAKEAMEGPESFIFVTTCILRNDVAHFILDPTPAGDADGDGVDDKAYLMEPYPDASEAMIRTLKTGAVSVVDEPVHDKWGTFLSGYAPIFDASGAVIAAAGVDMDMAFYQSELLEIRLTILAASLGALMVSLLAGYGVWHHEKQLSTTISALAKASEAAHVASHAKTRFLATMSHEIRTPLNAIVGSTELLREAKLDRGHSDHLETILRSSGSLLTMLDDVLDYSSTDGERVREPVDLRILSRDILAIFREEAAGKGIAMEVHIDDAVPARWQTSGRLVRRILTHLVSNAVKFTSHGKVQLRIGAAVDPSGKPALLVTVSDTGIGIHPENVQRMFEPFVQLDPATNRRHEGAGLGLALCKKFCGELQTSLTIESDPGQGSSFGFLLPGEAAADVIKRATLITADRLQRGVLSRLLEKRGWQVQTADDVDQAGRFPHGDCVIFDLADVPSRKAAEYASQVIAALPAACHVAIDSGMDPLTQTAVRAAGARSVISRNPSPSDLDVLGTLPASKARPAY